MLYDHKPNGLQLPPTAVNYRRPHSGIGGSVPLSGTTTENSNYSRFQQRHQRGRTDSNQMMRNSSQMENNTHSQQQHQSRNQSVLNRFRPASGRSFINDMPVRMVMNAKYVGALIGQGGANIRQICHESKAKCVIDVTRCIREGSGNLVEKAVNIYGMPENCTVACSKILEIILRETRNDPANQGKNTDPELKMLAHNNLIGRLIGKHGATIKKIMEETSCIIFISNYNELSRFNVERTITVRGSSLQSVCSAENMVSSKLRNTWDSDMKNSQTRAMYGIGINPVASVSPFGYGGTGGNALPAYGGGSAYHMNAYATPVGPAYPPPQSALLGAQQTSSPHHGTPSPGSGILRYAPPSHHIPHPPPLMNDAGSTPSSYLRINGDGGGTPAQGGEWFQGGKTSQMGAPPLSRDLEISYVWVPGSTVGALIGTQGSNIRKIMRSSGARIHIDSPKPGTTDSSKSGPETDLSTTTSTQVLRQVASANEVAAPNNKQTERRVIIMGTEIQQYKSQFWVFHRLCEDHYIYFDSMRLCIDIPVPGNVVGRIIGKKGHNIQELQRFTGAQVRLISNNNAEDGKQPDNMFIRIIGNFSAAQVVQTRVRQVVRASQMEQNRQRQQEVDVSSIDSETGIPSTTRTPSMNNKQQQQQSLQNNNFKAAVSNESPPAKSSHVTMTSPNHVAVTSAQQQQASRQNGPAIAMVAHIGLNSVYN